MADKRQSLRAINDEIEELCWHGVELPELDGEGNLITLVIEEDELEQRLNKLGIKQKEKIENIGYALIDMGYKVDNLTAEIRRLTVWRDAIQQRSKWLKWYTVMEMMRAGLKKISGKFVTVSVRKSPVSADYATTINGEPNLDAIDPKYVKEVVTYKVDKKQVIKDFKASGEVPKGFNFHTENQHLVVK